MSIATENRWESDTRSGCLCCEVAPGVFARVTMFADDGELPSRPEDEVLLGLYTDAEAYHEPFLLVKTTLGGLPGWKQ